MRNLYAGILVVVLCGAAVFSLGGCQESLALLGDDIGSKSDVFAANNKSRMAFWSAEAQTLAKTGVVGTASEPLSAMVEADKAPAGAVKAESLDEDINVPAAEIKPIKPLDEAMAALNAMSPERDIEEMPEAPETGILPLDSFADKTINKIDTAVAALPESPALPAADKRDGDNVAEAAEIVAEPKMPVFTMPKNPNTDKVALAPIEEPIADVISLPAVEKIAEVPVKAESPVEQPEFDHIALPAVEKIAEVPVKAESPAEQPSGDNITLPAAEPVAPAVAELPQAKEDAPAEDNNWQELLSRNEPLPEMTENNNNEEKMPLLAAVPADEKAAPEAAPAAQPAEAAVKADADTKTAETAPATPETPKADAVPAVQEEKAAPVVTAEQKKINDLLDKERIRKQAIDMEAGHHYRQGVELFKAGKFGEALTAFDRAIAVNPGMTEAVEYRTRARQMVGRPDANEDAALLDDIVRSNTARLKERELSLNSGLEKASQFYLKTVMMDDARKLMPRAEQIQMNIVDLDTAEQSLLAVRALLTGSGFPKDVERNLDVRCRALAAQISQERQKLVNERAALDRASAEQKVREESKNVKSVQLREVNEILAASEYHLTRAEYEDALTLVEQALRLDRDNKAALELRHKIRTANRQKSEVENIQDMIDSEDNWALDVQEQYIMPRKAVVYPMDWDRIRQRARKTSTTTEIDSAEREILDKLNSITGDFEYVEQTLAMVMNDFAQRAKICITLANGVNGEDTVKTARLSGVTMKAALKQIMEDMKLTYKYEDEALVIYPQTATAGAPTMQIYTIADIVKRAKTFRVKKRMANQIKMDGSGENEAFKGDDDDDDDDDEWREADFNIVNEIKKSIGNEQSWESPCGVSRWEDNLVVFNTPEIQSQVAKYLEEWRASSKQQVLVEGRFMDIDDTFAEEFGIDWSGSKSNETQSQAYQTGLSFNGGSVDNTWGASYVDGGGNTANRTGGWKSSMNMLSTNNPLNYALNTLRLNLTVRASEQMNKGSTLHNPKVLVQNGQKAYCQIVINRPYIGNYTINDKNVIPTMMNVYQGVTWEARPVISFDRKYITVLVRPEIVQEVSEAEMRTDYKNFQGSVKVQIPLESPAGSSTTNITSTSGDDVPIKNWALWEIIMERPVTKITDFWTSATVPDGGTLMIGGEMKDKSKDNVTGVPVLSSLPYIGRLMRTDEKSKSSSNRVIMLSAKIVDLDD